MNIHELVKQFMERIQTLNHLLPILPEEALYIRFECDSENMTLAISKNGVQRKEQAEERRLLIVRGSKEAIAALLNGELKLQQQMRLKEVFVSGSFRHMLLFESILHLGKPYRFVS